jgi:hypothetical protein
MTILSERCAEKVSDTVERIIIAESARPGEPHVGVARRMRAMPDGRVEVEGRFAQEVYEGAQRRARIALVVWDRRAREGFQVLGSVEDADAPKAQAEWGRLVVRVGRILEFNQAG